MKTLFVVEVVRQRLCFGSPVVVMFRTVWPNSLLTLSVVALSMWGLTGTIICQVTPPTFDWQRPSANEWRRKGRMKKYSLFSFLRLVNIREGKIEYFLQKFETLKTFC